MISRRIPLNGGKRGFALVSAADYERVAQFNWTRDTTGYVCRTESFRDEDGTPRRRKVLLHRYIVSAPVGLKVDHRNWNRLDNRRCNLRWATQSQNNANTKTRGGRSQFKGVYLHKSGRWRALIQVNGHRQHLGIFNNEADAARAYDMAALAAWGEFAHLNFPSRLCLYWLGAAFQEATLQVNA